MAGRYCNLSTIIKKYEIIYKCFQYNVYYPKSFQPCPYFSEWGYWQSCSRSCGTGERIHTRICINGKQGDVGCIGPLIVSEQCNNDVMHSRISFIGFLL